jgi:hypothetical protein
MPNADTRIQGRSSEDNFANYHEVLVYLDGALKTKSNFLDSYGFNDYSTGTPSYYGFENEQGSWVIMKLNGTNLSYSKGSSGYATAWTNKVSQTYDTFANTF